jgi:hypothetical protein
MGTGLIAIRSENAEAMIRRAASVAPWAFVFLTVASQAAVVGTGAEVDVFGFAYLSFPAVGLLIVSRQPRNAIGWVLVGFGFSLVIGELLRAYVHFALTVERGSLPGGEWALALQQHAWVAAVGLPGTFLILLFPDGRLPSPRWKPWAYFCALALVLSYVALTILPRSFSDAGYPGVRNPLGVDALGSITGAIVPIVGLIPIAMVGCAVALVRRFRRSSGIEHVQLKWLTAATAMLAATYLGLMALHFLFGDPDPPWLTMVSNIGILGFTLIPAAIGWAILRHRLYDIDVIINRTLVYSALTVTLTGAYLLLVAILQGLLRPLAGQSDLAVAGSTLVVAAIFRPVRGRIQTFVDRRFYRSKFDAQATLEKFSARLREEVDLEALTGNLLAVVNQTMKPATSSLWLRPSTTRKTGAEAAAAGRGTNHPIDKRA